MLVNEAHDIASESFSWHPALFLSSQQPCDGIGYGAWFRTPNSVHETRGTALGALVGALCPPSLLPRNLSSALHVERGAPEGNHIHSIATGAARPAAALFRVAFVATWGLPKFRSMKRRKDPCPLLSSGGRGVLHSFSFVAFFTSGLWRLPHRTYSRRALGKSVVAKTFELTLTDSGEGFFLRLCRTTNKKWYF